MKIKYKKLNLYLVSSIIIMLAIMGPLFIPPLTPFIPIFLITFCSYSLVPIGLLLWIRTTVSDSEKLQISIDQNNELLNQSLDPNGTIRKLIPSSSRPLASETNRLLSAENEILTVAGNSMSPTRTYGTLFKKVANLEIKSGAGNQVDVQVYNNIAV